MPTATARPFPRRRAATAAAMALALLAALAPAAHAWRAPDVKLLTSTQRQALGSNALLVRLAPREPGTVLVAGRARNAGVGYAITSRVRVRLGRAAAVVALPLTPIGRQLVRRCGDPAVAAVAIFGDSRGRDSARLLSSASLCRNLDSGAGIDLAHADRCDFIGNGDCLFPFPNDYFTVRDRSTPTGRRVNFSVDSMPRNSSGTPIDPTEWNRNDGFSPGESIVLKVPGLDNQAAFDRTGLVPETDIGQTYRRNQPVVLIDAKTGRRQLIWAELDSNATSDASRALIVREGRNLQEGHRYIVALRDLRRADGSVIPAGRGFQVYRDGIVTDQPAIERRRAHFRSIFRTLRRAGIGRRDLYLAWDFTVASTKNLTDRMLAIRNDAFAQLGDHNLRDMKVQGASPKFKVTQVEDFTPDQNSKIARRVTGTFTVPCYLDQPGCPAGSKFHYAPGASVPSQMPGNTYEANFICIEPRSAFVGGTVSGAAIPARPSVYGHGLLGDASEVNQGQAQDMTNEHRFIYCATDEIGFSEGDVGQAVKVLGDFSYFPTAADRTQQGLLNELYLGRLMIHSGGFGTDPAFQGGDGRSLIDGSRLFYDGNSQGGILGGAFAAVSVDADRISLGVNGMNYSTLLTRSVDFNTYKVIFNPAYPNELQRPLILAIVQMLWDRAEADGYANHMTDHPLPDTPPHKVVMSVAVGDFQVAPVTAEVEARTIGARLRTPAVDPGRSREVVPFYGIAPIPSYPYSGSALVMFDSGPVRSDGAGGWLGVNPAPAANVAPTEASGASPNDGVDPHEYPRRTVTGRAMKSAFLSIGGKVIDTCDAKPCYSAGWTGP